MNYTFKINDGLKFGVNTEKNTQFGMTAGNAGGTGSVVIPDGIVTSSTIKHIEAVSKQWYITSDNRDKDTVYIIKEE